MEIEEKKIWPNIKESLPCGKKDQFGKMVTDSEELKILYAKEFKERLRKRPVHPDFKNIQDLKDEIFELKIEKAKTNKTEDWTIKELEAVLTEIKKGKSRDPEGMSRELFHPSIIGENLKMSILIMFNKLKKARTNSKFYEKDYNFTNSKKRITI